MRKSKIVRIIAVFSFIFLLFLMFAHPGEAAAITEWDVPGGLPSVPYELVVDDSSYVWFTEYGSGEVARFNRIGGGFNELVLPTNSYPWGIDFDKNGGYIYFSDAVNKKICRISSSWSRNVEEFRFEGAYAAGLRGIAVDSILNVPGTPDRTRIWFASFGERKIGMLNLTDLTDIRVVTWVLPDPDSKPWSVIYSQETGLWFTDYGKNKIGNIPDANKGAIKFFGLAEGSSPVDLDTDSFGNVWFTESGRDRVGKINPVLNELTEYVLPLSGSQPFGITVDYSNRVWFALRGANAIGVFNPDTGTFTKYQRSGSGAPSYVTMDKNRNPPIYFTDPVGDKIGKVDPYVGLTTVVFDRLSTAQATSSTGASSITLSTGVTDGFFSQTQTSTQTTASQTETVVGSTSYIAMEIVTVVQTSRADVSTIFSTETATTTTLTTATGTSTSYIATVTGTATTTSFATSTSYIATTSATFTSTHILTSYTTTYQTTTGQTSVIVVPGFTEPSIIVGFLFGSLILIFSHRIMRTGIRPNHRR